MELLFVSHELIEFLETRATESPEEFLIYLEEQLERGELTLHQALDMLFDKYN